MRIISFSKKWLKLEHSEFTTFRVPRKDSALGRDWHKDEVVQVYYHSRCPNREYLGTAKIIDKVPCEIGDITDSEAMADGFPGGWQEMINWLKSAHGSKLDLGMPINKLTLVWVDKVF